MSRSKVPGYREGLNVYQTFTCPRTDFAWTSASLRMNCSVGGDQSNNHYYCIPNAERTHFVEFCYDRASMKTEKGNCWELGGIGYLNQVDCTNFVKGCPNYMYLSERVYKIPACLDLNFSERCFTMEPGCIVLKNSTNALANNQNSADTSLHLGLVALITCVLTAVILLLVVYWVKRYRPELCLERNRNGNGTGITTDNDQQAEKSSDSQTLLSDNQGNRENKKPDFKRSSSVAVAVSEIEPNDIKGHISHLHWSIKTGAIWASNDRGKLGLIDLNSGKCVDLDSGKGKNQIETCSTYSGHFAVAAFDNEEQIYWVHNEKKWCVKRDSKNEYEKDMEWEPISIFFSNKEKLFYVGKVINNDAKITRYDENWSIKDDIHRYKAKTMKNKKFFRYPAYLVKNINDDLCVSDNNKRVIVLDNNKKLRFRYTAPGQTGFTPYGICTDSEGHILIVDSTSMYIHILDKDGELINRIQMSAHLKEPRGLCIDNRGKCYVGTYGLIYMYNVPSDDTRTTTAITALAI